MSLQYILVVNIPFATQARIRACQPDRHVVAKLGLCNAAQGFLLVQNGTVAAASYAGSTLAYVAPHMAGAIDILVVEQPDGTLKCSPFYGG